MQNDPAFVSHNAADQPYHQKNPKNYASAVKPGDNDVSFVGQYAGSAIIEDKAETGKYIESAHRFDLMSNGMMPPRIVGKYETLLARLAQAYPALAYYFSDIES